MREGEVCTSRGGRYAANAADAGDDCPVCWLGVVGLAVAPRR